MTAGAITIYSVLNKYGFWLKENCLKGENHFGKLKLLKNKTHGKKFFG
jgi:hypothetical protein